MPNGINAQTEALGGEIEEYFPHHGHKARDHAHRGICSLLLFGVVFVNCNVAEHGLHDVGVRGAEEHGFVPSSFNATTGI